MNLCPDTLQLVLSFCDLRSQQMLMRTCRELRDGCRARGTWLSPGGLLLINSRECLLGVGALAAGSPAWSRLWYERSARLLRLHAWDRKLKARLLVEQEQALRSPAARMLAVGWELRQATPLHRSCCLPLLSSAAHGRGLRAQPKQLESLPAAVYTMIIAHRVPYDRALWRAIIELLLQEHACGRHDRALRWYLACRVDRGSSTVPLAQAPARSPARTR